MDGTVLRRGNQQTCLYYKATSSGTDTFVQVSDFMISAAIFHSFQLLNNQTVGSLVLDTGDAAVIAESPSAWESLFW